MAIQICRELNADVVKRGATRAIYAKQHDVNSRFLNIRIQEEGKDIVVAPDLAVWLNVTRPDNLVNVFSGTVNDDGSVKVPLTKWMLELEGTLTCDVSVVSEDPTVAKLTTMQFHVYVEAAVASDTAIEETEEYSIIVDLLNRVKLAEETATEMIHFGDEEPPERAVLWIVPSTDGTGIVKVKQKDGSWAGVPSLKGSDGKTPFIGENGNWWIGDQDTGVLALTFSYGQEDLEAGVSELATGKLHFVYE